MSTARRLERLEERRGLKPRDPVMSAQELKRRWLEDARNRRRRDLRDWEPYGQVRDIIRLLRNQGRMGMTTEELLSELLAWRPPHDPEVVEREISRFIYAGEEGTENMVCPPEWREALEAADRLRERYAALPDDVAARWLIWLHDLKEGVTDEDVIQKQAAEAEEYGITNELMWKAVGPDAEDIGDDEPMRRVKEILADFYYGEQGYRVQQEIYRLMEERTHG